MVMLTYVYLETIAKYSYARTRPKNTHAGISKHTHAGITMHTRIGLSIPNHTHTGLSIPNHTHMGISIPVHVSISIPIQAHKKIMSMAYIGTILIHAQVRVIHTCSY